MSGEQAKQVYERYADVTQQDFGTYIRRTNKVGVIDLIDLYQTPGDFSDRASSDIAIIRMLGRARCHLNFSSGMFTEWSACHDFNVSPAGFANEILIDHHHRVDVLAVPWAALVERDADNILPSDSDLGIVHAMMIQAPGMSAIFEGLWNYQGPDGALVADTAMVSITESLVAWMKQATPARPVAKEALTHRQLARCKERLAAPGASPPTLNELAALCGLSSSHLCRAFKASTGLPPHQYQIVQRMERAKHMLLSSSLPVAEIAAHVGYDDPAYFSRLFARETGCTPSGWRRTAA